MNCPSCSASVPAAAEYCPQCLAEVRAAKPAVRAVAEPAAADVAVDAAPAVAALPAVPQASCAAHADMVAAGTCVRCGRFYCVRCVPDAALRNKVTCAECVALVAKSEAPEKIRKLRRELWVSFILVGAFAAAVFIALPIFATRDPVRMVTLLAIGAVTALPLIGCGILYASLRRRWVAWTGVVFELVFAAALIFLSGKITVITGVMLAVPILTAVRMQKLLELERTSAG